MYTGKRNNKRIISRNQNKIVINVIQTSNKTSN